MFGAFRRAMGLGGFGGRPQVGPPQSAMNSIVQRLLQKRVAAQPGLGQAAGMSAGMAGPPPPPAAPAMAGGAGMAQSPIPEGGMGGIMGSGAGPAPAPPEGWADELNRRLKPPTPGL